MPSLTPYSKTFSLYSFFCYWDTPFFGIGKGLETIPPVTALKLRRSGLGSSVGFFPGELTPNFCEYCGQYFQEVGDAEPEKFGFSGKFIRRFDLLNKEESAFVNLGCCTGCYRRVKKQ
jgi:hypothetical protein